MCIRDRLLLARADARATGARIEVVVDPREAVHGADVVYTCLLYTSDAADERSSVDLGGRRIIKQKNTA